MRPLSAILAAARLFIAVIERNTRYRRFDCRADNVMTLREQRNGRAKKNVAMRRWRCRPPLQYEPRALRTLTPLISNDSSPAARLRCRRGCRAPMAAFSSSMLNMTPRLLASVAMTYFGLLAMRKSSRFDVVAYRSGRGADRLQYEAKVEFPSPSPASPMKRWASVGSGSAQQRSCTLPSMAIWPCSSALTAQE